MLTLFCKQSRQKLSYLDDGSFDAVLDCWLGSLRLRVKRSTFSTYSGAAARYIRPALGALEAGALTDGELSGLLTEAERSYSPGTVRMIRYILRSAVAYGQENGRCPELGAAFAAPGRETRETRVLSRAEQEKLERHLAGRGGCA